MYFRILAICHFRKAMEFDHLRHIVDVSYRSSPEEVCQSKYVNLFLEDRKELWSGELETEMKAITLTGVRDAYMGRIFVHQSSGRGRVYWRTVEGEGKFYWIPSDQYAMLEHCFSYPPYFGN